MSNRISGKKPLSSKPRQTNVLEEPDFFMNRLAVASDVKKELAEKGLDYRWISYTKYTGNGNQHERGWQVYRRDKKETGSLSFGTNPDGIIRVGDNVLAARPLDYSKKHKAWLASKADRLSGAPVAKADELRAKAKEANVDITVHEGFEENE